MRHSVRRVLWCVGLLAVVVVGSAQPDAVASAAAGGPAGATGAPRGVVYEIFVRSFHDSDGDGIGDLRGVRDRLPYLASLGVTGIWLTPIHPSPSYHGYDVTDYREVHPEFGTVNDFVELADAAGELGMDVIVDLVVNHTSVEHPWFRAALAGDPTYRDWYVWRDEPAETSVIGGGPAWHPAGGAHYLGLFWSGMPDLNHRNPAVTQEMVEIARFWLEHGADGFRVDAIQHIVEDGDAYANTAANLAWVAAFGDSIGAATPGGYLIGETWTQTPTIVRYHEAAGLDMSLNFPLYDAIRASVAGRTAGPLATALAQDARLYPPDAAYGTFLGNHDHVRAATTLSPLVRDERRLALAAGLLMTLPGTPFLYYGEEIGMPNGPGTSDPEKRTPMRWTEGPGAGFTSGRPWHPFSTDDPAISVAAQEGVPGSLLETYRSLIAMRRAHPALDRGATDVLEGAPSGVLGFVRSHGAERIAVLANLAGRATQLDLAALGLAAGEPIAGPEPSGGGLDLPPLALAVFMLEGP